MSESLFCYCLKVADCEFLIEVTDDGFIHWDDYQRRRRMRNPEERNLEIKAVLGSAHARRRLSTERDESVISFQLSPELFARFSEAARLFDADQWTIEHEEELDQHLLPLVWSRVNPCLSHPLSATR
jgi:hypothetical protein